MSENTPRWQKVAIIVSAFAAFVAALVAIYQGYKMRQAIEITHAITRPFLVIEPASQPKNLSTIILQVKNTGDIPARVLHESGKTWLSRVPFRTGVDSYTKHVIYPDEEVVLTQVKPDEPSKVKDGRAELKMGYAVLYESVTSGDRRRWISDSWFFFNPKTNKLEIWKRDETQVSIDIDSCNIEKLMPKGWLEYSKPQRNKSLDR